MSHNTDFKTLRLWFLDGQVIVFRRQVFPGKRELRQKSFLKLAVVTILATATILILEA